MKTAPRSGLATLACTCAGLAFAISLSAQTPAPPPPAPEPQPNPATPGPAQGDMPPSPLLKLNFPPPEKVLEGYTQVISTTDGLSFWKLYQKPEDHQLIAELPKDFARQKHYIALTIASGDDFAGLQAGERYVYWKQIGKQLAMIEPNLETRSTGDNESKASVQRLFTDRVIVDMPILSMVPNKRGPIIDLDELLVQQAEKFFGSQLKGIQPKLATIKKAKAFPDNVEVAIEVPNKSGRLQTLHYSISLIPENKGYKARKADERVGYFTTNFDDFGQFKEDETRVRYINRWQLEKADPNLKLSPPKEPIVFYLEHTTPIRYRRWVRDGALMWNKAFEKVGLVDAIEVRIQDAATEAHMDKDPEDVRYNFIRWLNNGIGTAIGPSRAHPETGQILDADIILSDGWIRYWWRQYNELIPQIALQGFTPQTLAWLEQHPNWDPRVRLAPPQERQQILSDRATRGATPFGGHPAANVDSDFIGDQEFDGLLSRYGQKNGMCMAANWKSQGIGLFMMGLDIAAANAAAEAAEKDGKEDGEKEDDAEEEQEEDKEQLVDGIPESFIGPLLADLVAHEVGHTLGLRHNFKATGLYSLEEINSSNVKEKQPFASSVMDYIPINISAGGNHETQGDWAMIGIGPYDIWAIEYGYAHVKDDKGLKPILDRVAEPGHQYATDEDTWGPDPLARRYDFGRDPHEYAQNQMRLVRKHRTQLIDKFVKEGQSWSKARRGYEMTLSEHLSAISMMANWVGGSFVYRDKKGDRDGRAPLEVVPVEQQRRALRFVVSNAFPEDAYGLTPEMLRYMTVDKWWDDHRYFDEPTWPVHDRILGIQAYALTALLSPSRLEWIYDNEFRIPSNEDALTLAELMQTLREAIYAPHQDHKPDAKYTPRKPLISSIERNLQKEYLERLIDLIDPNVGFSPAYKPISDLATAQLADIKEELDQLGKQENLDAYSKAHLTESSKRIEKALEARYVYDLSKNKSGLFFFPFYGKEKE